MKRVLRQGRFKPFILSLFLLGLAQQARSTTVVIPADDDLITDSRAIIVGRVLSTVCGKDETERIFTYITVRVLGSLKGDIATRKVVLKEEGGEVAGSGSVVFGTPRFRIGEKVLLYLGTWPDGSLRVQEMFLGKFSIITNTETGEQTAVRSGPDSEVVVLNGHAPRASERQRSTDRMEFNDYVKMVRERVEATRQRSEEFLNANYRDVPLLSRPPEFRELESRGELQPYYTFLSPSTPPRWFNQPVVFNVNPAGAPNPQITDDITTAMSTWSNISGCALEVTMGGTTSSCRPSSTENTIIFNNCDGRWQASSTCSSILAVGGCTWTSITTVINGTTFYKASSGFISFNPYASCSFSNRCNVQEITVHELGHALGLGHSADPTATMYFTAHFDGRCAGIRSDDAAGMLFMYPGSPGGPGPLTIVTASPLPTGSINTAYSTSLTASGGTSPYTWSLLSGSLPVGLSLGPGGTISGTPTSAGTSTFSVQVRDGQSATAQKQFSITIASSGTALNAQYVSQTVPTSLQPGQSFQSNIKWTNTGTETWGNGFRIVSKNPDYNTTWGGNTVPLAGLAVAPGQTLDLTFTAFAPSTAGTYNFQWQLYKDGGAGFFGQSSPNVSITVASQPSAPSISGPSSADAVRGSQFSLQLTGAGGRTPYSWSVASGSLPGGISLNSASGLVSGTATVLGAFAVTIQLTDSDQRTAQKPLTINVVAPALAVSTSSLPSGLRGTAYSQQLGATGGVTPYSWAVTSGALPGGLSLGSTTGVISGVPTAGGDFGFTVTATDAQQKTANKQLSIRVETPAVPPLLLDSVPTIEVLKGSGISYQMRASGGAPAYAWSITLGALPSGVSLDQATGLISGTANAGGAFTAQVTVRDQANQSASTSVLIRVTDPDTIPVIIRVKYKGGRKLIVSGQRFDPSAVLLVDGTQVASRQSEPGLFVVKPLALAPGAHDIRVMNPNGVMSQSVTLSVE